MEEKQCFSSGSRSSALSGKSVPPATGAGHPTHSLPLAPHEINCCPALHASEGEDDSQRPVSSCFGLPASHPMACGVAHDREQEASGSDTLH